ncbi:MAG TPA: homoserine O-acetyltransferase [Gammaproteobacteria bacterium]|nr:homoserine O-acetyltransferase [Gammaproteobacteria bacterium]
MTWGISTFTGQTQTLTLPRPLRLESGHVLPQVTVAYRTWGRLNAARDNAVMVCHALTGTPDVDLWWGALLGRGRALDPTRDFIVCSNVLGGCYGSTGPRSLNPATGKPWGGDFPAVSVRDMVKVQRALLDALGVARLALVIGGSLGGMQALEWAASYPEAVDAVAAIACGAQQSAWAIGFSEAQRQAIYADPEWQGGHYDPSRPPAAGLAAARMMAMLSYRHWHEYAGRFNRARDARGEFEVVHYLRHHGDKLVRRFDAASYVTLTRAMDTHDLARGRGDPATVFATIKAPSLIVGVDSDVLYPLTEQQTLAIALPDARLAVLHSPHGHDAFLIDTIELDARVHDFRHSLPRNPVTDIQPETLACTL